jgi:cobalt-zinc-cadmium efflux system membrane fusion protein
MSITTSPPPEAPVQRGPAPPILGWVRRFLSVGLAVGALVAVVIFGRSHGWKMPKLSALMGWQAPPADDWCQEHGVPESICLECQAVKSGHKHADFGWCKQHGVHECPFCHPEVAQTSATPDVAALVAHYAAAQATAERAENNSKCKLHLRKLQFTSGEAARAAGVRVEAVGHGAIREVIEAPAEVVHDPASLARLSARLAGTAASVEVTQGQRVQRGAVLARIEAPGVGKAQAELVQAGQRVEAETRTLAALRSLTDSTTERRLRDVQAALDEAIIARAAAEQNLANLGLTPEAKTLPVVAPCAGVVLKCDVVAGEAVEQGKVLFVLADPERVGLLLRVKQEDVGRLRRDLPVNFRADGSEAGGKVAWIGRAIEDDRTVPVRVTLEKATVRAGLFGTAEVVLREADAVVVPGDAVHWEGCCHVVFVQDRQFADPEAAKVFQVRKVQPGAALAGRTEILAGLVQGEVVATAGSGLLRGELLRNNLGAG